MIYREVLFKNWKILMHENIEHLWSNVENLVEQRNILKFHLKIDRFKYHDRSVRWKGLASLQYASMI